LVNCYDYTEMHGQQNVKISKCSTGFPNCDAANMQKRTGLPCSARPPDVQQTHAMKTALFTESILYLKYGLFKRAQATRTETK